MIMKAGHSNSLDGPEALKILSSLGSMKSRIIERKDFLDILGDLLSDLLIHETRKSNARLPSGMEQSHEALQEYEYFFSEMGKVLTILTETGRDFFDSPSYE
jgi:hypothetical protein